jgi:CRP-like cAMP-binding protein
LNNRIALATRGINTILDALFPAESPRLMGTLTPVFFPVRAVVLEPDRAIESVYFPLNGVISLVTPLGDGTTLEVATVGNEGMIGVPLVPNGSLAFRALAQTAGWAIRLDATKFLDEFDRHGPLRAVVNDYLATLVGQISQSAACNRRHSSEQRLSRWLLLSHDRAGRDTFDISREFLGQLLGSPPLAVALSTGILEAGGLIKYRNGQLSVVDRAGLESSACECYEAMRHQLDRVSRQALDGRDQAAGRVLPGRARTGRRQGVPAAP